MSPFGELAPNHSGGLGEKKSSNSFFIFTFFVIATKKVTKEKSRQTRLLRAFCLACSQH